MTALFLFAHPDIWSDGDVALNREIIAISELDNVSRNGKPAVATPYKSYLSLHLWKGLGTKIL